MILELFRFFKVYHHIAAQTGKMADSYDAEKRLEEALQPNHVDSWQNQWNTPGDFSRHLYFGITTWRACTSHPMQRCKQHRKTYFCCKCQQKPRQQCIPLHSFRSGSHWVLITIELTDHPVILYCDSNWWKLGYPPDLLLVLSEYTQHFGLPHLCEIFLSLMHMPTPTSYNHICTARCRNYPIQTCSNVCGLVMVVGSVIAALEQRLFTLLTGPPSGLTMYLHEPTRYERYLWSVDFNCPDINWDNNTSVPPLMTMKFNKLSSILLPLTF